MKRPKIGLALGSGGAKGFAHIGVIKVLEEHNIQVDYIAGSSMGALVGSLYAIGYHYEPMFKLATTFRRNHYLDFTVPRLGFISGKKVTSLIRAITKKKTFADAAIPVQVVATNLANGERIIFEEGYLYEAIRASISIPGIFIPVQKGDMILVDGGVIDRVPVNVVKQMGADIIIAVDVASASDRSTFASFFDVIVQSIDIMQQEMVKGQEQLADVMLKPNVSGFNSKAFTNMDKIIKIGEETARHQITTIEQTIREWKGP
ncbi:patatin-like phospholipase family protein [Tuberibacillus sp. Marseille-P3662]|uniref:patatin-like phospholipase family protein n=1 Tax=Tuberibacillus sp. Marseille-P3662 TaxID=1965358 RepID=UPI000A1CD94D|nr:patatin-like phospholipase family protein [Tuberibacillus sp. Marseille-P3662]